MTPPLIRLDELQAWVFSTQEEDEELLTVIAGLATGIVLDYCGPDPVTLTARTWTESTVPDPVRAAILAQAAEMWRHRGDEAAPGDLIKQSELGELTPYAVRLLKRFREPVIS